MTNYKKIIYLANVRMPTEKAHGWQIMKMCQAFSSLIEVELVVPRRLNPQKENPFSFYGLKPDFKIKKIFCLDLIPFGFGRIGFWVQAVSFLLAAKFSFLFKKYDLIYTREPIAGLFFKNFILEAHALPKEIKKMNKLAYRRAKKIVVLTSFIKKRLIEVGISGDKIIVSPDAVDLSEFQIKLEKGQARKKLNLPADKILLGYIGMLKTLNMEKGVDVAINSLKSLSDRINLVLVGGHPEDIDYYRKMATDLGLDKRIIFAGQVKHDLVSQYLEAFDILIAPFPENEHYKYFMSPLKIFEYMAANKPIVTTDLPSIREVLSEKSAILAKPGSEDSLAEGINKLVEDPEFGLKIAEEAFAIVKNYTWDKRAEAILNFSL